MFVLNNEDQSIYCTRGDCCEFPVKHQFKQGDVVRFKVFRKKDCETVVLQRDFTVEADTDEITISLTGDDTKIGEVISKPTDYWYEVELNPDTHPQTIIGYDEDGAKVFKLFPEGKDVDAEDIEVVGKKTLQELVVYTLEQAKEDEAFRGEPFTYEDFTPEQLESLKGDNGNPGVYLGSGDMPSDCNVQIDPEGEVITLLDAVTVAPQTFTEEQKAQARENIGSASATDLQQHIENKNNPHGVTLAQIGAAPASHVTDMNNPHGVTPAQIGAALAGYGLGDVATTLYGSVTDITKSGWYWYQRSTASGAPYDEGIILASVGPYHTRLDFFVLHHAEYSGCHAVLHKNWNTWGEWEWENPPLLPSVEYRTTERCNGKAVYTKFIDLGAWVKDAEVEVGLSVGRHHVIRSCGVVGDTPTPILSRLDLSNQWTAVIEITVESTNTKFVARLNGGSAWSGISANVTIWYTKN